jgi:error-prone DNA polymerase
LQRRARLDGGQIAALAAADALASLCGHRREALWSVLELQADAKLFSAPRDGQAADVTAPTEADNVVADYRHLGLTLRSHPLLLLRPRLGALRLSSAAEVRAARHGQLIRTAGLVTCRQHPETAKGTTFVTLEDETGDVNVVVWARLAERSRRVLLFSRLLAVAGKIERQGEVVHLIAGYLMDHSALLRELGSHGGLDCASRDFR